MPSLTVSLDLELTSPDERELLCWVCDLPGPEWKLCLKTRRSVIWRGLHTECKVDLESKQALTAVRP